LGDAYWRRWISCGIRPRLRLRLRLTDRVPAGNGCGKKERVRESTLNNQLRRKHCLLGRVHSDKEARVVLC